MADPGGQYLSASATTFAKRWVGLHTPGKPSVYALYVWPFLGAFAALAVLQAVFGHSLYFILKETPALVTSYGASVVLCFDKIESPLAQPRALIGGHFISGLIGIVVGKILYGSSIIAEGASSDLTWLGAALATAIAILAMQLTKTTHPPAGATALLPVLDPTVNRLSWYFLPVLLLSSTLVMFIALLINNVQRKYPTFWWEPAPVEKSLPVTERPAPSMSAVTMINDLEAARTKESGTMERDAESNRSPRSNSH